MERTIMIAIDSSTKCSGFSIFQNGEYQASGIVTPDETLDITERVRSMIAALYSLLENVSPNIVVIERMNVGRNVKVARALSEIIGSIFGWSVLKDDRDVYFYEISPTEWRKWAEFPKKKDTGIKMGRKELKEISKLKASKISNKVITSDDEADAICIGQAYINMIDSELGRKNNNEEK